MRKARNRNVNVFFRATVETNHVLAQHFAQAVKRRWQAGVRFIGGPIFRARTGINLIAGCKDQAERALAPAGRTFEHIIRALDVDVPENRAILGIEQDQRGEMENRVYSFRRACDILITRNVAGNALHTQSAHRFDERVVGQV